MLAMKRDPFTKRKLSKGGIVAICVGCILAVALIGGIYYALADQQQDDLAVESTVITDTDKADKTAETSEDDEVDESTESDGEDAIEESADEASEEASSSSSGSSTSSGTSSSSSSDSSSGKSSSSSSNSSSSSSSSHSHNWVAQTKTVHHDAVYETVYHSAVKEQRTICNGCGTDITGNVDAHMKANILNGCGSYTFKTVVVQDAYEEQVLVTAAYDETVTTGYKCSTCGATKS